MGLLHRVCICCFWPAIKYNSDHKSQLTNNQQWSSNHIQFFSSLIEYAEFFLWVKVSVPTDHHVFVPYRIHPKWIWWGAQSSRPKPRLPWPQLPSRLGLPIMTTMLLLTLFGRRLVRGKLLALAWMGSQTTLTVLTSPCLPSDIRKLTVTFRFFKKLVNSNIHC